LKPGRAVLVRKGEGPAVFAAGSILKEALAAADLVHEKGVDCAVYSFSTVKPIDKALILDTAGKVDKIITLEEHTIIGGLGGAVAEIMAEAGCGTRLIRLGLNDEYSSAVGSQTYLRSFYGLDAGHVAKAVLG
jgi:transketolase